MNNAEESSIQKVLRQLPQVEELINYPAVKGLSESLPHDIIVGEARNAIEDIRREILEQHVDNVNIGELVSQLQLRILNLSQPSLRRVVNASGVIVHTNLGRSVLAQSAVQAVTDVAKGYSTLEYDPQIRSRGSRNDHCEQLICALTGAESAIAINNNAAAVMMVLSEFAADSEVIVSRGELVEIGGSFRIPDIMAQSHAKMVEVGTTNKTHASDYENALTESTAMLLKVHPSNYRMVGFTENVSVRDLHGIADQENKKRGYENSDLLDAQANKALRAAMKPVVVYEDQGSGSFMKLDCFGNYAEPTVKESLAQGADLVSFSGDKLLGGPQAGIIVGSKTYIDRLKKNPLARAMRLDKMTLAALEATLRLYLDKERALKEIPTLAMLTASPDDVQTRAQSLASTIQKAIAPEMAKIDVVDEISRAGGGALPMCDIPTFAVQVTFIQGNAFDCDKALISERDVPIIARLKKEKLLFDARTLIDEEEYREVASALAKYFASCTAEENENC